MSIKFSELNQKNINECSYIAGLYEDSESETNQANCKIPANQFAKQSSLESDYVSISGNQEITGEKSFSATLTKQSLDIDTAIIPQEDITHAIAFKDKNGVKMGSVESCSLSNGSISTVLNCEKLVAGNIVSSQLSVGIDSNGLPYATAPTPQATDNSNKIATTAWAYSFLSTFLSSVYPIGSIYLGTQASCPMATLISGSTWELVGSGKALWCGTGFNGNTSIEAGLPNITGNLEMRCFGTDGDILFNGSGALSTSKSTYSSGGLAYSGTGKYRKIILNAQNSNSIYGKSSTVQPPAYVVNVWRRTA